MSSTHPFRHICYLLNRIILDDKMSSHRISVNCISHRAATFHFCFCSRTDCIRARLSHSLMAWSQLLGGVFAVNTSRLAHNSQMNVLTSLRWETKVVWCEKWLFHYLFLCVREVARDGKTMEWSREVSLMACERIINNYNNYFITFHFICR